MGGDDLGSDDEFQTFVVQDEPNLRDQIDGSDDEVSKSHDDTVSEQNPKKRKLDKKDDSVSSIQQQSTTTSSAKKIHNPEQLLLQAGRDLESQDTVQQAAFINTALSHYTAKLTNSDQILWKLKPENFKVSTKTTLEDRISESVSLKKMKKWKELRSPCVVVICLSARRAVSILKNLSKLKIRAAKLFPKNGSVTEQCELLSTTSYGLAVGTPHRLLALCPQGQKDVDEGTNDKKVTGNLSFNKTKLIVLDTDTSNKQYTVCTLPDTAPHCMELLRSFVIPQLQKRQDMHLAFF